MYISSYTCEDIQTKVEEQCLVRPLMDRAYYIEKINKFEETYYRYSLASPSTGRAPVHYDEETGEYYFLLSELTYSGVDSSIFRPVEEGDLMYGEANGGHHLYMEVTGNTPQIDQRTIIWNKNGRLIICGYNGPIGYITLHFYTMPKRKTGANYTTAHIMLPDNHIDLLVNYLLFNIYKTVDNDTLYEKYKREYDRCYGKFQYFLMSQARGY